MLLLAACSRDSANKDDHRGTAASPSPSVATEGRERPDAAVIEPDDDAQPHRPRCGGQLHEVLQAPALPGTPGLDEHRAWVVARNKGEPVVFVRTPEHGEAPTPVVAAHRRILDSSRFPSDFLNRLSERGLPPQLLRQIVLRRGYVYGKNIAMSNALVQAFELRDIFDEPEIWIERGSRRLHATRGKWGKYYYKDGPDAGRRAKYFHFDRLGVVGQSYGPPLHRDARRLMHELHFDRMRVQHRTENHVVARLRYGGMWVTTLLRSEGARLELVCEAVPAGEQGTLARVRREAKEQAKVMVALRASMLKQVREELPFDEPTPSGAKRTARSSFVGKRPTFAATITIDTTTTATRCSRTPGSRGFRKCASTSSHTRSSGRREPGGRPRGSHESAMSAASTSTS